MSSGLGHSFKMIRKNKNYSQKYVSENVLTQSAYSKFELNKIEILSTSYITLLERIEMTSEEFTFIKNGYKYLPKEKIINWFFNISYNNPIELRKIILETEEFLKEKSDFIIQDIKVICEALIILNETQDIELTRKKVEETWIRLSQYDNWYLTEIKLINAILFLFPVDTAIEVSQNALNRLKKYHSFRDSYKLEINFKLNMALLLIKNGSYNKAVNVLNPVIETAKAYGMYKQLAAAYVRSGICVFQSNEEEGEELMQKGVAMLEFLEDYILKDILKVEIEHYTNAN